MDENDRKSEIRKADPEALARVFEPHPPGQRSQVGAHQQAKKDDWPRTRKDKAEAAAVLVAFIVVGVSIWQGLLTRDSNKTTRDTLDDTRIARKQDRDAAKTAAEDEAHRYDAAIKATKEHNAELLKKMQGSNDLTRQSLIMSQRAWVGVQVVEPFTKEQVEKSEPPKPMTFRNFGNGPAFKLHHCYLWVTQRVGIPAAPASQARCDIEAANTVMFPDSAMTTGPEMVTALFWDGAKLAADGKTTLYLVGSIWYEDQFREPRKTTSCLVWRPAKGSMDFCSSGNTAN